MKWKNQDKLKKNLKFYFNGLRYNFGFGGCFGWLLLVVVGFLFGCFLPIHHHRVILRNPSSKIPFLLKSKIGVS